MYYRKLVGLERLADSEESFISNESKERKEIEDRKEKIELLWTK